MQSLRNKTEKQLLKRIKSALEEEEYEPRIQVCLRERFESMIAIERSTDYNVFYRVISDKYVLYHLNTYILKLFCDIKLDQTMICTPSLSDADYPSSMAEVMVAFEQKRMMSDMCPLAQKCLVSVNCCLCPVGNRPSFHREMRHEREASPLHFFEGYDGGGGSWTNSMADFMATFFDISADEAANVLQEIHARYQALIDDELPEGHCLQILVPKEILEAFAYPCVSYGEPVVVCAHGEKLQCFKRFPGSADGIPFQSILDSKYVGHIQARILAHPNLFLLHGARVHVHTADPYFDAGRFAREVEAILAPYVQKGKTLRFEKFTRI